MIRKYTQVEENDGTHLENYGGEQVLLKCMNYFYHGVLTEINEESVKLDNAYVVFETGDYSSSDYKDKQALLGRLDCSYCG